MTQHGTKPDGQPFRITGFIVERNNGSAQEKGQPRKAALLEISFSVLLDTDANRSEGNSDWNRLLLGLKLQLQQRCSNRGSRYPAPDFPLACVHLPEKDSGLDQRRQCRRRNPLKVTTSRLKFTPSLKSMM